MNDNFDNLPDPEIVARAAAEAPAPRMLEDYNDAISILRDKKFTFREIAEWLTNTFGIPADHNSVWRAYTKHMNALEAHREAEADEETERDDAMADAYASGSFRSAPVQPATAIEVAVKAEAVAPVAKAKSQKAKGKTKK